MIYEDLDFKKVWGEYSDPLGVNSDTLPREQIGKPNADFVKMF
jgi:hypothetical protein